MELRPRLPHGFHRPLPTVRASCAVSGAHVRAAWLHHPCLLRGPQHGDKKWGKGGDNGRKIGGAFGRRARRSNVLSRATGRSLTKECKVDRSQAKNPLTPSLGAKKWFVYLKEKVSDVAGGGGSAGFCQDPI